MYEKLLEQIDIGRKYRLNRKVFSGRHELVTQMDGVAQFDHHESGMLRYQERVENKSIIGTRSYLYSFDHNKIEIYFDESPRRIFVSLPDVPIHKCGQDIYEVDLNPQAPFTLMVIVKGPKKNYWISTTLS